MSIVNMFGFDHMPDRISVNRSHMVAEGFDALDLFVSPSGAHFNIQRFNNRAWLALSQNYYYASSSAVARQTFIFQRTLAEMFGNPATLKKGVIGMRMWVDPSYIQRFIVDVYGISIVMINGVEASPTLAKALTTPGEHFVEIEFDFVNNVVKTYLNATLLSSFTPGAALSGTSALYFGSQTVIRQDLPTTTPLSVTDIYITHDNNNDELSGRLGPIKVLPLTVDKSTRPANWGYSDADAFWEYADYDVDGGVAAKFNAHLLIPRYSDTADIAGQFKYDSTPPGALLANISKFLPPVGSQDSWMLTSTGQPLTHNFTFTRPKKVAGYALMAFSVSYGCFDNWTFEGSVDGQSWTVLDTRTKMNAKLGGQAVPFAFRIAPAKIAAYRFYRMVVTKTAFGAQSSNRVYMNHMQLLGLASDVLENELYDGINRVPNSTVGDLDYPVIRTGIDSSEATFGFAVPEFGTAQVLAVKVGLTGRRDQASSEHIRAKLNVGAANGTEKVFELKSHAERHEMFPLAVKAPDGTLWTKENLETLRVVVKSKSGAK